MTGPAPGGTTGSTSGQPARRVLVFEQAFDETGLNTLRAAVVAHVSGLGAPTDVCDSVLTVVGELASNAILHGGGAGHLRLWHTDTAITCEVSDDGPGMTDARTAGTIAPPPAALRGRGLWIARQLSQLLDLDTGPGGTTVTCVVNGMVARAQRQE